MFAQFIELFIGKLSYFLLIVPTLYHGSHLTDKIIQTFQIVDVDITAIRKQSLPINLAGCSPPYPWWSWRNFICLPSGNTRQVDYDGNPTH